MSQLTAMNRRLLWKETRQVMPLAITLIVAAIVLSLWFCYLQRRIDLNVFQAMAFMPPILFSLGVGTVLVSQEKETRSLNWLTSLPVPPRYLIRHQFLFGLFGVAVLWFGCLIVYVITQSIQGDEFVYEQTQLITFFIVLNSVYLLVCSFAVAWLSRAPILGLFSVLPLAVVPYLLAYGLTWVLAELRGTPRYVEHDPSPTMMISMLLLSIGVVGTLGYRVAQSQLCGHVHRAPSARKQSWLRVLRSISTSTSDYFRGDSQLKKLPPTSTGSLLWQFRNQNRGIVFGLYAAFLACFPIAWITVQSDFRDDRYNTLLAMICTVIALSSLSWMSLLTFHGDHVNDRVRFLAIHGVSPTRVWWTRQVVPFVYLVIFAGIWVFSMSWQAPDGQRGGPLRNLGIGMITSQILIGCGIAYAVSQWLSQLIRPAAIAALVAPLASVMTISLAGMAKFELGTPIVVIVLALVILPLVATWWTTQRWMDGRRGWRYWLRHASLASVAALLPLLPFGTWYFFSVPGFSKAEHAQLTEELSLITAHALPTNVASISTAGRKSYDEITNPIAQRQVRNDEVDLDRKRRIRLRVLSAAVEKNDVAIIAGMTEIIDWVTDVTQVRLKLDESDAVDETTLTEYRDYMRALTRLVAGMRRTISIQYQESADSLEIWLLAEIAEPETRARLDDVTFAEIVRQASASDLRWESRRRALIASLDELLNTKPGEVPSNKLGTYQLSHKSLPKDTYFERLQSKQRTEQLIKVLLKYIDDAKSGHNDFPRDELIEFWAGPAAYFGVGPAGPYLRIDDVSRVGGIVWGYSGPIAMQWGAGWEQTGRDWASKLNESSNEEKAK